MRHLIQTVAREALFLTCLAGVVFLVAVSRAEELPGDGSVVSMEDRLAKGLKARQPHEFEFVDEVVAMVHAGRLHGKLVDSTFLWALQRQQRYPFPLFERALRLQANRLGVEL